MKRASRALCSGWKGRWQMPDQRRERDKSKEQSPKRFLSPTHGCAGENCREVRRWELIRWKAWPNHGMTVSSNATWPWKCKYDPPRGISSRNWQGCSCTTRPWQEYQLQLYWPLFRKDELKWEQVQRRMRMSNGVTSLSSHSRLEEKGA